MATRRIFLRDLSDKYAVIPYGGNRFVVTNEVSLDIVLTKPLLKRTLLDGVIFEDFDTTGDLPRDVIFTKDSYTMLEHGQKPRRS